MKKRLFSMQELSSFCLSLHLVMQAGIPIEEGVSMLTEEETDSYRRKLYQEMYEKLDSGEQVHKVLADTGVFPKYMVDMIEIGERTGNLDDVFHSLSQYYDQQEQISKSIRSAVLYPSVLLVIMIFVVAILVTMVLPVFNDVYNQLGSEMSPVALALMNFGLGLSNNWYIIVPIICVIIAAVSICLVVPNTRKAITGFFSRISSNRATGFVIGYTRFASAMAMTLASGMDVDESVSMALQLTENPMMQERIEKCRELLRDGMGFAEAVSTAKLFPSLFSRMLAIGVKTGSTDTVMSEIARRGEAQVDEKIASIIGKLEPTLVIIMSVLVGLILLSVMLPLVNIMSAI